MFNTSFCCPAIKHQWVNLSAAKVENIILTIDPMVTTENATGVGAGGYYKRTENTMVKNLKSFALRFWVLAMLRNLKVGKIAFCTNHLQCSKMMQQCIGVNVNLPFDMDLKLKLA